MRPATINLIPVNSGRISIGSVRRGNDSALPSNGTGALSTMPSTKSARKKTAGLDSGTPPVESAVRVASLLKQVGDPTRLQILLVLADGKKSPSRICERLGRTPVEISHNLALLRYSGFIHSHREGKRNHYELTELGESVIDFAQKLLDKADPSPKPTLSESEWKKLVKKVGTAVDDPEDWLNTPNPRFEGRRPIDLIGTDDEVRVHIIIEAAAQGCFS
jgi:DNA-binding transcriptional ArsR family regulator